MNLRTPRRRISPQTRRRCRAIKGFFKRALGSVSQPDLLQITSSIAVNVTDINHKIVGLEEHLSQVCQHCRDQHRESYSDESPTPAASHNQISQQDILKSSTELKRKKTDTSLDTKHKISIENGFTNTTTNNESNETKSDNKMNAEYNNERIKKLKKKKSKFDSRENNHDIEKNYQRFKSESQYRSFVSAYSTSSFHSLDNFRDMNRPSPGYSGYNEEKRCLNRVQNGFQRNKIYKEPSLERYQTHHENREKKPNKEKKSRNHTTGLDSDFIADIIKRQYKPVKFGRRHSDLSQFSVPACRDQEFGFNTKYNVPKEPCNCGRQYCQQRALPSDVSDIRSVCDARFYNAKRNARPKPRKKHANIHENSEIYDLVPVKEKSSPKSRRKFIEDNMCSAQYKEVPPSPISHRPQFNLKTRYAESDYNLEFERNSDKTRQLPKNAMRYRKIDANDIYSNRNKMTNPKNIQQYQEESTESRVYPNIPRIRKLNTLNNQQTETQPENSIVTGLYPILTPEDAPATAETSFNKTQETALSDKTDKALSEIKDILQNFLREIKKETSPQKDSKTNNMTETGHSPLPNDPSVMTNYGHNYSNFNSPHPPVAPPSPFLNPGLPAFANPCCYPVMPMCPINCNPCLPNGSYMQTGYPMPSTSFTCNKFCEKSNETCNAKSNSTNKCNNATEPTNCETDQLIKEIYKFVLESPTFSRKGVGSREEDRSQKLSAKERKLLTSRSAGGSTRLSRHDVKVGTTRMNCASKSCEAIGRKIPVDLDSDDTNATQSDTALDRRSTEVTQTSSETEISTEPKREARYKGRNSKLYKVLKSFGLRKKIKSDTIEELSESESTVDVSEVHKKPPPFRQHVTNCMMYEQEYNQPPPMSPHYRHNYPHDYRPHYNDPPYQDPRMHHATNHGTPHSMYQAGQYPSAPPYPHDHYGNSMQPQVPLCLKEVEVKSIGCQSERKLSFFRKMTQKMNQPTENMQRDSQSGSSQTLKNKPSPLFNWKTPPPKVKDLDPMAFTYKTQKKLALSDAKMKKAMLKKMFYKRNPFSPRNLIIKTLLGKDKSSYGEPPGNYRMRMFL